MIRRRSMSLLAAALLPAISAHAGDNYKVWTDIAGDAVIRRTDPQRIGTLGPGCQIPDLTKLTIGGWETSTPATNPYAGEYHDPRSADLLRIDIQFVGVVNPPGSLSPANYDPFKYGSSPLYGCFEFDIDRDNDTGGEIGDAARTRYLANIGRFGRTPYGSIHDRGVEFGWQADTDFFTAPFFERSGADFVLSFCGCYSMDIVSETGTDHIFQAGDSWIVRGGFFQRSGGYQGVCSSTGGAAGLQVGLYVPYVNLRWQHLIATNTTTVTLIYPLTMAGSAQLAGQGTTQPPNSNVSDQNSIVEALTDLINGAPSAPFHSPVWYLSQRWVGRSPTDVNLRDVTRWGVTALVGTAYTQPVDGYSLAWTDTGFGETPLDMNGDGIVNTADELYVRNAIDNLDGSIWDSEGQSQENGGVALVDPGINFAAADVDGSGSIDRFDIRSYCVADFNRDGIINILDYVAFLNAFSAGDPSADLNGNGILDPLDFAYFSNAAAAGCS